MSRLPIPGQDDGIWGNVLNDYLNAAHNSDGTLKDDAVGTVNIQDSTISEDKLDTALAAKVNMAATGVVPDATNSVKGIIQLGGDLGGTSAAPTVPGLAGKQNTITPGTTAQYYRGDKTFQTLDKTAVGLANVDNTSDVNKPISGATQTALNAKAADNVVVHLSGNETITGTKNFTGTLQTGGNAVVATNDSRLTDQRTPLNGSVIPSKLVADVPATGEVLSYNGTGFEWITPAAGGGGGEANTTSNIGTAGVGIYKQKTGVNFELKKINAASTKVSVVDNVAANQVDIDINQANLTLTKSQVGLGNVDNTADASKPISTAQQTALDLKADESITITGATSLTGGGNLTANRTISLVGDSATPGNSRYYGTDGTGTKGYFTLPGGSDPTMGGDISGTASNAQIVANAVTATEIAANAVTTAKILDANVTEAKLSVANSPSTNQVLSWNGTTMAWTAQASGGGGTRSPFLMVASAQAPADIKAAADYLCDGTNDDVMINQAIQAAALQPATPTSFSSIGGYGKVVLSAGAFDITAPLVLETGVMVEGMGVLTELRARGMAGSAVFELSGPNVHLTRVTSLWINGNFASGNAHGFHYDVTGGDSTGRPTSDPDWSHWIDHLMITGTASGRHGIWTTGNSGGSRACKINSIRMFSISGNGLYLQGSSDSHITDVEISTEGVAYCPFVIASGNCVLTACKAFYSELDGFSVTSSRAQLVNCVAQDNGRYGFNLSGATPSIVGGQCDSNARTDSSGGGVLVGASGTNIIGLVCFDRGQTPTSPQLTGIEISGTPNALRLDANINVPSGSAHVTGNTSGTGNYITIVRNGTTPLKVG